MMYIEELNSLMLEKMKKESPSLYEFLETSLQKIRSCANSTEARKAWKSLKDSEELREIMRRYPPPSVIFEMEEKSS